jgi:hypothetical protein
MLKAILDWANQDSTQDLNSRFEALFTKGVLTGGTIAPITGQTQISLLPFTAMSKDGMLVVNDEATVINIVLDQTNIIAVHAKHLIGEPAILEIVSIEASIFNGLAEKDYYVVFGAVTTISPATEIDETDISYSLREMQDKRTRDKIRGMVNSVGELPSDPNFNLYGDLYVVYSGVGQAPNIYAWDGINWINITGAAAIAIALDKHQRNLDSDLYPSDPVAEQGRLHLTNYQSIAALGSYGIPGHEPSTPYPFNRYVTQLDPRIPTTDQSAALVGSDGLPSTDNKYVTEEYPVAQPTILAQGAVYQYIKLDKFLHGPVYVGRGAINSANVYFSLLDATLNRGYLNTSNVPILIIAVYKQIIPTVVELNPFTDADEFGFYNGPDLWLGLSNAANSSSRLVYGRKQFLKNVDRGFPVLPTPTYEIINSTLLSTIANIKGRNFDEIVPTDEQNINLRSDINSISSYLGSVLETNVVATNEDFIRLSSTFPEFEKNVGVDYKYVFKNEIQSQFSYDTTTGLINYYSIVDLSGVTVGDLFIDAAGNKYEVWAVGTSTVNIKNIGLLTYPDIVRGAYPESVDLTPYAYVDGSIISIADGVVTFENTSLVSYSWVYSSGWVQYSLPVVLTSVSVGDLFRDGGGTKYLITAVDTANYRISIVSTQTGLAPLTINTSVGNSLDGSTWINNNPRDVLYSEMKFNFGNEFIPIKRLVRKTDEFSQPDNEVSFGIVRHDNRFEPRIIFYGSWENYETNSGETYVRNINGNAKFIVSGYFNNVFVVMRRRTNTGNIAVSVNGINDSVVDPTASNTISSDVAGLAGPRFNVVKLNSTLLDDLIPSSVSCSIGTGVDSFDIYGFIFYRTVPAATIFTPFATAMFESGRAFESAKIIRREMPDDTIVVDNATYQSRGGRLVYAALTNSYSRVINSLTDMDSNGTPRGTWVGNIITIIDSGGKLSSYNVNDVIIVNEQGPFYSKICRIVSIGTSSITVDLTPATSGATVNLLHVCSTDSNVPLPDQEDLIARYILPDDFINHTPTDLEYLHQSDRFVIGKDGLTVLSGQSVLVTDVNVIGSKKAVQIQQGSSGTIRFNVLATRLDLLCVNNAAATVYVSIDGSPDYLYSFTNQIQRRNIFSNARYQSHEVTIKAVTGNFSIAEMFLYGPKKPEFTSFPNEVADISQVAYYQPSQAILTSAPNVYPTGSVFKEASANISFLNSVSGTGNNWSVAQNFTKSPFYGNYISTDKEGAYIEFYIFNTGFELQYITGPDHGRFNVFIDGVDLAVVSGVTIVDSGYSGGYVEGYAATYNRKNIAAYGLSDGFHKITAKISTPRVKNGSSSGYRMAFTGFYEANHNTRLCYGINSYGVYTSVVDIRKFNAVDFDPLDPTVQKTETMSKAGKVNLNIGTTSLVVTLAEPYLDTDYIVTPCLVNMVDPYPLYQSLLLVAQTASSFTLAWNVPTPNGNYSIHYYTRTTDV